MKKWLILLLLPPVVIVLPWLLPATQRRWGLAVPLLVLWLAAYAVMFKLWVGVGFAALVLMGLAVGFTSSVEIREESA